MAEVARTIAASSYGDFVRGFKSSRPDLLKPFVTKDYERLLLWRFCKPAACKRFCKPIGRFTGILEQALRYRPSRSEYASQCRSLVGILLFGDFLSMAVLAANLCRFVPPVQGSHQDAASSPFQFSSFSDLELGQRSR
jgi:hypothetical protein